MVLVVNRLKLRRRPGEVAVDFYNTDNGRHGTCWIALSCARNDAYLRSLVQFMKVRLRTPWDD